MMKLIIVLMIVSLPLGIFAQGSAEKKEEKKGDARIGSSISTQAQYSKNFTITNVYFNRRLHSGGKGEVLEVEMKLNNKTDETYDLYIFVIATYEDTQANLTSFSQTLTEKEKMKSFVPYPMDLKNFEYPDLDKNGNVRKDKTGKELTVFQKFPRNPKAGIDAETGKPYSLVKEKFVLTTHLSKYRADFYFFNQVAIIVFDSEGKPVFRQLYDLKGFRR